MDRWRSRVVLVTGASAGIGAAICKELAKQGLKVIGCARNVQKIQDLANECNPFGSITAIKCDLTKEEDISAMFDRIRREFGRIDICINNAGLSFDCQLLTGRTEEWRTMLDVNVLALCICTRESIKLMKEKDIDDGQIIQLSSMSGHRIPDMAIYMYAGTKYMVKALAEGLRLELRACKSGIKVACISPGLVETEFEYRCYDETTAKEIYSSIKCMQPEDIVQAVLYVLRMPRHVDVNDILMRPTEQNV